MTSGAPATTARSAGIIAVIALAVLASGCGTTYRPTPLPAPASSTAATSAPPVSQQDCDNATRSYEPEGSLAAPDKLPAGSTMAAIRKRGRLIAGVSGDSYLLGARNPATGAIEGFDIDMVKAIAKAILGDAAKYELRVITAADRVAVLQDGSVDIVARAMTMTCARWDDVAFSAVYLTAGQRVLVRTGSGIGALTDLAERPVCAPAGTSSITNLVRRVPDAVIVTAADHTGCLVRFQSGEVEAITGDDTVLAGLAAQDPYAELLAGDTFSSEPYGIAVNADHVDLVRFINARLDQMRKGGEWQSSYDRWLKPVLGKASPPKAEYGR